MRLLNDENPWIVSAESARRHIPGFVALAVAAAIFVLTFLVAPDIYAFAAAELGHKPQPSVGTVRLVQSLSYFVPLNGTAFLLLLLFEQRPWPRAGIAWGLFGLLAGGLAFLLTLVVVTRLGVVRPIGTSVPSPALWLGIAGAALIIGLRTFGEEFFFRGWLQPLLAQSWGAPVGLVVTSLLFALAHIPANGFEPVVMLNVALAGAFFGLLALRTGGLAAAFAAHWLWNTLEQCVFGLTPNPGVDQMGSLIDLDLVGPTLYSGGNAGLNGSIGTTVALVISIAAVAWIGRWSFGVHREAQPQGQ